MGFGAVDWVTWNARLGTSTSRVGGSSNHSQVQCTATAPHPQTSAGENKWDNRRHIQLAASVKYAYLHYCIFGVDLRVLWPAESPDGAEPIISHRLVVSCPPPSLLAGGARFEVRGIVERGALTLEPAATRSQNAGRSWEGGGKQLNHGMGSEGYPNNQQQRNNTLIQLIQIALIYRAPKRSGEATERQHCGDWLRVAGSDILSLPPSENGREVTSLHPHSISPPGGQTLPTKYAFLINLPRTLAPINTAAWPLLSSPVLVLVLRVPADTPSVRKPPCRTSLLCILSRRCGPRSGRSWGKTPSAVLLVAPTCLSVSHGMRYFELSSPYHSANNSSLNLRTS